ncbi:MOSC domain-containing protein [Sphingomonas sp. CGMCC 1.13654]|uniref:MOSC domain-containing protein n=1 Tax=Sphingomonas chungangi TaxID=2683589 RepID=A0A838LEM5_9SPHN|nr:MOSC domain-containing protein [Sphingomonas chungangi]MBA2935908.1 MOSC domain-containing protein [Sphingomonas chungangi]MVW54599.1 MOSC domain-containing protein [Sphingomonas chungangi]
MIRLHAVQTGRIAPLGPDQVPSGYVKWPTEGRARVGALGLAGDEIADLSVHGGPEKAVYGYSLSHYAKWQEEYPQHAVRLQPGAFGENLTIDGLAEEDICLGDIHRVGTSLLQVCQPRQPCFKFALFFEDKRMLKAMVRSGRAGWYYRVLQEGELGPGDEVVVVDRPQPDFPFSRLVEIVYGGRATRDELLELAAMDEIASSLRAAARESLR